jgi:hypothetical protein
LEQRDIIVTPILLLIIYAIAFVIRPYVTDEVNRRYFFPGLTIKIAGAIAVGFIYQFWYHGGDTFAYHTHGSRHIWEAFMESPSQGLALLNANGEYQPGTWEASQKIWYWRDPNSYFVIKIAAIFDLFTFSSYSGTAVLFAVFAFTGGWMLFRTFYNKYPEIHGWIALSVLFIPTVVFWGSGLFKDSVTLACLGVSCYAFDRVFIQHRLSVGSLLLIFLMFWIIFSIKKYILLTLLPALLLWAFAKNIVLIKSMALRILITPIVAIVPVVLIYFSVPAISEDDQRYNISNLAQTAKLTAYDIRYGWGARTGEGSGYNLGELDGSWQSMVKLAPQAVNVSLFRPYLWEVKNPLMLLSGLEALLVLGCTLFVISKVRMSLFRFTIRPDVLFCLLFSIVFAFAVGISTYNFGTLSRYKIPLMPFYMLALGLIYHDWKSERKTEELASVE